MIKALEDNSGLSLIIKIYIYIGYLILLFLKKIS